MCEHLSLRKPNEGEPRGPICEECGASVPCDHPEYAAVQVLNGDDFITKGDYYACTWCGAECLHNRLDSPTLGNPLRMCMDCRAMVPGPKPPPIVRRPLTGR